MNKTIFFIVALIAFFFTFSISSKEFHLLTMADTNDPGIGGLVALDADRVISLFSEIAKFTETPLHTHRLDGSFLTLYNVEAWIENKHIAHDDVIIVYYSGHGFRKWKDHTIWPRGSFPFKKEEINFYRLMEKLFSKSAAFCFVLFDCCNDFLGKKYRKKLERSDAQITVDPHIIAAASKKLFFDKSGFVVACSASPGETANAGFEIEDEQRVNEGSTFTIYFLDVLESHIRRGNPRWKKIFAEIKAKCLKKQHQTTKYLIHLHKQKRSSKEYKNMLERGSVYKHKN